MFRLFFPTPSNHCIYYKVSSFSKSDKGFLWKAFVWCWYPRLQNPGLAPSCRYCLSPRCFSSFRLGATQKEQRIWWGHFRALCVWVCHGEGAQVTLFSSFICMLGANPAMDLKTNHSYWFHCEFAVWNNSQKKRLPCSYKQKKNKTPKNTHQKNNSKKRNPELSFALDKYLGMLKSPLSTSHWKLKESLCFVTEAEKCYYLTVGCGHCRCYNISHFKS